MEREKQIIKAKQVLRDLSAGFVRRHKRMHDQAAEDNINRLRALEGICGNCQNLIIRFPQRDGRNRVTLECKKGHFPGHLYGETPMGKEAVCEDLDRIK
jgi:hypothetical protein